MCPRFSSEDPHLDMTGETYDRIHAAMDYAHTVDFTGWGEPLMHRRIYEMVQMARDKGCLTTMTSNGTALTERNIQRLLEAGLTRLVVSVDGMRPETYDPIRIGASFDKLTANLKKLASWIERANSPLDFGIAFTIQEGNAEDLERVVPWMKEVGARTLHLKQLNVISNASDWRQSFLKYRLHPLQENGSRALSRLEDRIERLRQEAGREGIRYWMHSEIPLSGEKEPRHCLATPLDSAYFSYEGRVAPCCHFGHHVSRYFEGEFHPPSSLFFGDIRRQSFEDVWMSLPFVEFRRGFERKSFPEACRSCYLLYGK
jgi:Fe-coproporphyrin III synthase